MFCLCHNCPILLRFWFQNDLGRENSAIYLKIQAGGRSFLTIVTPWSRSTSNFYALIAQNLTDEFTRKIYAASWSLFTSTAETDKVLCQLAMSGCTKWIGNTAAFKSLLLFMAGLFIGFLVEKYVACQSRKSDFGWHRFCFSPQALLDE